MVGAGQRRHAEGGVSHEPCIHRRVRRAADRRCGPSDGVRPRAPLAGVDRDRRLAVGDRPGASPTGSASTPPRPRRPRDRPDRRPAAIRDPATISARRRHGSRRLGGLTAQHADGFVRPAPANATTELSCNWIQEGVGRRLLLISTASAADVSTGVDGLDAQGYECQAAEDFGAQQYCVKAGGTAQTEDVVVARGRRVDLSRDRQRRRARVAVGDLVADLRLTVTPQRRGCSGCWYTSGTSSPSASTSSARASCL